jgi:YaiO family outer membrane protein
MKGLRFFVILVVCFWGATALGSNPSGVDQGSKEGSGRTGQRGPMPDEWERDPDWVKARELEEMGVDRIMGKRNRMEFDLGYASLSDQYGSWKNSRLMYLRRELTFTYFFEMEGFLRKDGDGVLWTGGIIKDWKPWFYTYTALATGTNSNYLPQFRFDQDLNFKFGKKREFVFTLGGTYVDYHADHEDLIFSAGITGYFNKWILGYRIFRNISYPGSVGSLSHTFDVTYGREGSHWTSLVFSYGNQAYSSTELASPEKVDQTSQEILLKHRHWMAENWGLYGEASAFHLNNEYRKYGFTLGVFWDF